MNTVIPTVHTWPIAKTDFIGLLNSKYSVQRGGGEGGGGGSTNQTTIDVYKEHYKKWSKLIYKFLFYHEFQKDILKYSENLLGISLEDGANLNPGNFEEKIVTRSLEGVGGQSPPPPLLLSTQFIRLT